MADLPARHAVMASRSEPHDSLDDFPTPPWAARALCEHVLEMVPHAPATKSLAPCCWEPACNRGFLARGLECYFWPVIQSDIHAYGGDNPDQIAVRDFLWPHHPGDWAAVNADWIITNPPFRLAAEFVERAMEIGPRGGVAILARNQWIESIGRYQRIFHRWPNFIFAPFVERVPMVKGRCDPKASTATAYAWFVWPTGDTQGGRVVHIPPCRKELERQGDYETHTSPPDRGAAGPR